MTVTYFISSFGGDCGGVGGGVIYFCGGEGVRGKRTLLITLLMTFRDSIFY